MPIRKPTRAEMAAEHRARARAHRQARLKEAAVLAPVLTGNPEVVFGRILLPGELPPTTSAGGESRGGVEEGSVVTGSWDTGCGGA